MTEEDDGVLDDEAVLDYLRRTPNFFVRHAQALSELDLPHESGTAVSLIERQVAVLRERNMTMRRRMNDLMAAARANDEIFHKTRSATLAMLEVGSWHELNEVLATHMLVDFDADFVCCHLTEVDVAFDHIITHANALPTDSLISGDAPTCLTLRPEELAAVFPIQSHDEHGSVVLLPLALTVGTGCLAVGSRDPQRFASDMDTLFVTYIADVLSRLVSRLA